MRLDKYLKVARILKRRTISKELAEHERILVNGKIAKPSKEINLADLITVVFGQRMLTVRVLATHSVSKKEEAAMMYEIVEEKYLNE